MSFSFSLVEFAFSFGWNRQVGFSALYNLRQGFGGRRIGWLPEYDLPACVLKLLQPPFKKIPKDGGLIEILKRISKCCIFLRII